MARKKPLNEWETAHKDVAKEKHYTRIGDSFFDCKAVAALTPVEYRVLLTMLRASAGKKVFTFSKAFYASRGISPTSFDRAKKSLIDKGFFIKATSGKTTREKNIYQWSNEWKHKDR